MPRQARHHPPGVPGRDKDQLGALGLDLTVLGRYSFTASVPREGLRPLRDPDAIELDDDDDGGEDV